MKKNISLTEKLDIIKMIKEGISVKKSATKLNKSIHTIYNIKRNQSNIIDYFVQANVPEIIGKFKQMRKLQCENVEKQLYNWFAEQRSHDNSITEETLIVKAKSISKSDLSNERKNCEFSN
ncbi:hypothetical protein A3Q56_07426, partial [Intoshia linei]